MPDPAPRLQEIAQQISTELAKKWDHAFAFAAVWNFKDTADHCEFMSGSRDLLRRVLTDMKQDIDRVRTMDKVFSPDADPMTQYEFRERLQILRASAPAPVRAGFVQAVRALADAGGWTPQEMVRRGALVVAAGWYDGEEFVRYLDVAGMAGPISGAYGLLVVGYEALPS